MNQVVVRILTFFYSTLMVLSQLLLILRYRSRYFKVKKRIEPPALLMDPANGTHHFAVLKSSIKLHYVANGDPSNPLILFVHGFPEFWFSWRHQLKYFGTRGYYAVAVDMRGYNESEKPPSIEDYNLDLLVNDLVEFLDVIKKPKVNFLVGHDWGGAITWAFAAYYPSLVEKLIILNAPHPILFRKEIQTNWRQFLLSWYIFFFQCPILPEYCLAANDLLFLDDLLKDSMSKEEIECYKYFYSKPGALTPPLNYYRAAFGSAKPRPFPEMIHTPTMVIWGKNDIALNPNLARCEKYVADFRYQYIDEGTHFVQSNQPEKVNQLIETFITNP